MADYPNLVWEMFATAPDGDKVCVGNCDYERGADLLLEALAEKGFTSCEKRQVLRENAGRLLLPTH